jgi:hypothetical protein
LERWKAGILEKKGFGILECWANGNNRLDDKIEKLIISFKKPTIPSFHYSIIPWLRQNSDLKNALYFH